MFVFRRTAIQWLIIIILLIASFGISFTQFGLSTVEASSTVVAFDLVGSSNQNLISYTNPFTNAFGSGGDGFQVYQRFVSSSIPYAIADDSLSIYTGDNLGIIKEGNTDEFFGIVDTVNGDNSAPVSATWVFDISSGSALELSIDMGAMGDFESSDYFNWTYSIDGGATETAFASLTDEAGSYTYTLEGGANYTLNDPMTLDGTVLSNNFSTFTAPIVGTGSQLTLTLTASFNGGSEAVAFQNVVITQVGPIAFDLVNSSSENLLSYTNPFTDAFASAGDGFKVYQRFVSSSIPYAIADDSLSIYTSDNLGIIKEGNTDEFFGIVDTVNGDNSGPVSATWVFDISSGSDMGLSIDMGAMGDFEAASDFFTWTYNIDGGSTETAFASSVDEASSHTYTLEGGASYTLNDPMTLNGTVLTNNLSTFTAPIIGAGSQLTLTLTASFNGGTEAVAFQNIIIGKSSTPPPPPEPEPELEFIHGIQGNGDSTPLNGVELIIEGIVVGDFQDDFGEDGDLNGFYVQEEDTDVDGDPTTSEGIFVYQGSNPAFNIAKGDLVRITGTAGEYGGQTQISDVTDIAVLSSGNTLSVSATIVSLPVASLGNWEYTEGMLVTVLGTGGLTVNDTYDLGRYGSFQLSSGGRIPIYSQLYNPSDTASYNAYHEAAQLRTITVDDGRTGQNPNPTPIINGAPFSASNTVRSGYTTTGVTGILNNSFGEYRIHPTTPVSLISSTNPRTPQAPSVGGEIRIASVNLLNYFNGDGLGGDFPTSRGADSYVEFERQRAKTIAALVGLDADIIGLLELENDYGDGINSAAQDLVNGLNSTVTNCGPYWAYVDPGTAAIGDDVIAVGFLYCSATVQIAPNTSPAILDDSQLAPLGLSGLSPVFNGLNTNRASFAVTFNELASNSDITIVVNHFKSKGGTGTGVNADTGNGAGNYNQRRRDAATVLNAWLATNPTGTDDNDVLIIGDLNAYAMEDPLQDLSANGYGNLVTDPNAYSYGFPLMFNATPEVQGWGTLDYALGNSSLTRQVTGTTEWHNNADEPVYIDYNLEYKPAAILASLYAPDAYRASDHDPLVVGMTLNRAPVATFGLVYPTPNLQGETVDFAFANIVDEGGVLTFEIDCTNDGTFDAVSNNSYLSCDYPNAGFFTVRGRITDDFGDSSEYTIDIQILTPLETVAYLDNFVDGFSLNNGQANALDRKFINITRSLERGNVSAALDQVQGLADQVQNFVDDGILSASDGNTVIYLAYRLMSSIVFVYGS